MDHIKIESTEIIEGNDSEAETESPPLSEDSESFYEHLQQTGMQICTDDFSGQCYFDFCLDQTETSKRYWMYSAILNKVYIDMNRVLPVRFQWQFDKVELLGIKNVRIRALPIFATPEFRQLSIKRCPIHIMQDKMSDSKKIDHILWCEQNDAIYEEDPYSQRYSVVVNVHNSSTYTDSKVYNVLYKFMCKSSCNLSLSRRPIYVIFTLETVQGQVLGRKKLGVKVCSCPRRDMLKEEEFEKKRLAGIKNIKKRIPQVLDSETPNKILKADIENDQNTIYQLPALPVPGKQLYISTLELLHGHILGSAVREDRLIDIHPLISMISELISNVKSETNNGDAGGSQTHVTQISGKQML